MRARVKTSNYDAPVLNRARVDAVTAAPRCESIVDEEYVSSPKLLPRCLGWDDHPTEALLSSLAT